MAFDHVSHSHDLSHAALVDMLIMGGHTSGTASLFILTKHPQSVEQLLSAAEAADFLHKKNVEKGCIPFRLVSLSQLISLLSHVNHNLNT